jgi:RimJ/RimL family protein N-acetyltransferase/N-acetylglutamate synthase-like GNAT family acetyltransferase
MLRIVVREAGSEDFGAVADLLSRVWPHRVGSEQGLRHTAAGEPPDAHRRFWVAEDAGSLVGFATAKIEYQSSERPGVLQVSVAQERRRAGFGAALLERCQAHLTGLGVVAVLSSTTPEEASRNFAVAHGFRHTSTTRISGVDPRTIEPPSVPPGVDLRSLAELEPRKVYELDAGTMLDVPGEVAMDDVSFDQWFEDYWSHPEADLDASVAAVIDDRPVAFCYLRIAPGGRAVTDMTGTLRDYRGRGLALLAKRATLVHAAERGVELVTTENDETNAPMLRINEKLGYRPVGTYDHWSRP